MKKWLSILLFCGLVPGTAAAQVVVQFGAPAIRWETRPPRVYVAPGMWVVGDSDDEVFYQGGWYWTMRDDHWYRSRDHRGHWGEVERARVPARLYEREPGYYRHYRAEEHHDRVEVRRGNDRPRPGNYAPDNRRGKPGRGNDPRGGAHDKGGKGHGRD